MLAGNLVRHQPKEGEAVGHRQGIRVFEIGLELPGRILLVEGENVPAEAVHGFDDLLHDRKAGQHGPDVVGRFIQGVCQPKRRESAAFRLAEQEEFRFDAEIEYEAHLGGFSDRPFENVAGARLERLPVQPQVAGKPRRVALPGQHRRRRGVGDGGHFIVIDLLGYAIESGAGEQLGPVQHLVEVTDRHHLAFRAAVNVRVAGEGIAHTLGFKAPLNVDSRAWEHLVHVLPFDGS